MGLITKEVVIKWQQINKKHYIEKEYIYTKMGDEFKVKVKDLSDGSHVKVNVECDGCGKVLKNIEWYGYQKCVKEDGKYYCRKCSAKLFGSKKQRKTKLKNSKSFEQWCIENNRQDILDRWDYELNNCKPSEITYGTNKKYYFKCPRSIHKSELKNINDFTSGSGGSIECKRCGSIAQWGIDNIRDDFLEKYWDYEKNTINPWEISYGSHKYVYIKCQEKDYHGSYDISCDHFIDGKRCSYCNGKKIHKKDSLGYKYPESIILWSDKNIKSPYDFMPFSSKYVWWKCSNGKHKDHYRSIINTTKITNFRCSECQYSKGEEAINDYLIKNRFIDLSQEEFEQLIIKDKLDDKNNSYYIQQKEFYGLIGLGNGLLSYDFYLPQYNLLIEYQGEQHEKPIDFYGFGKEYAQKQFEIQQEHDKRKCEYAKNNNIKLLEIWYYEFDKIEEILNKELSLILIDFLI